MKDADKNKSPAKNNKGTEKEKLRNGRGWLWTQPSLIFEEDGADPEDNPDGRDD